MSDAFKKVLMAIVIVAAAIGLGYLVTSWEKIVPPRIPLAETVYRNAEKGVFHNVDWTPAIQRIRSANMALVPSGCFQMGSTDEEVAEAVQACGAASASLPCADAFVNEQPAHEVCFEEPYWIDVYEVTNGDYGSTSTTTTGTIRGGDWPRERVDWEDAAAHCEARGARLPTEAEWAYAVRGPSGWDYAWGDKFDVEHFSHVVANPSNVGSGNEGASWVGAEDMNGSVREWVDGWYAPYSTAPEDIDEGTRIARGGTWVFGAGYWWRSAARTPLAPYYKSTVVGFRCATDYVK
jgi:formylglycine-generating enzyme required for sulfatase activity